MNELKAATETNKADISNIRENTVSRTNFDDFVKRLTDSFKELLPPISKEADKQ